MQKNLSYDQLLEIWKSFLKGNKPDPGLKPEVKKSWLKCRKMGIDPYNKKRDNGLNNCQLSELLDKNSSLISTVEPFINIVSNFIQGTGFIVVLTDKNGRVLRIEGDKKVVEMARQNGFKPGADRSVNTVGTNAIALAIEENRPIQIVGPEHFNIYHHYWTCSAAPVHDIENKIIGVLNFSGHYSLNHKHTLGMVASLCQAIEKELKAKNINEKLQIANKYLEAVLNSISEGVVAIDNYGRIITANSAIKKFLKLTGSKLEGLEASEIFQGKIPLFEVLERGQDYFNREDIFKTKYHSFACINTARHIKNEENEILGVVGILREKKDVHHLVNKIAGAKAKFTFDDIIGESHLIEQALDLAKTVSGTDTRVLLEGESGCGKELFAQAIHNASERRDMPFVAVNCSAIPRELIESELFGYDAGAFTGARKEGKPGKFELADGGTLFLDEISSMPFEMQAKLLRVLQQQEVTRVGGINTVPVDVRIIAASNVDLEDYIKEGYFREDLYYRLSVVVIKIPPLRERKEDIPILFEHLLSKISSKLQYFPPKYNKEILDILCSYDWPGNVRQLENYIERAVVLAKGSVISKEHFPQKIYSKENVKGYSFSQIKKLSEIEKEVIEYALKVYKGNISKTSRSLGITRNTLYNKLNEYNIKT